MIKIEISGTKEFETRLVEIPKRLERGVLGEMAQLIHEKSLDSADSHTKTGALVQSLYNRKIQGGREIGHDPQRAPHAVFVHWGTKPHVIKPKNKKALRWASGGLFNFAKVVNHPGYKGDPYLIRAAREALLQMDSIVAKHLKRV